MFACALLAKPKANIARSPCRNRINVRYPPDFPFPGRATRCLMTPPPRSASTSPHSARCTASRSAESSRSEEHTSELQSLMRISYAVFCLKKKTTKQQQKNKQQHTH